MKNSGNKSGKKILIVVAAAGLIIPGVVHAAMGRPRKEKKIPGKKTIACVGDSITFGAGVVWTRKIDAWPYRLGRLLGEKYQVVNYGISGATMQKISDMPYSPDFMKEVEAMETEAILLMLGTNDSKPYNWNVEEFEKAYSETVEKLSAGKRKLYVMIPPRAFVAKGQKEVMFDIRNEVIHDEVYPIVFRQAKEHKVPVIDLYQLTDGHPEYFGDGVHPNKLGNKVIAEYVYEQISRNQLQ